MTHTEQILKLSKEVSSSSEILCITGSERRVLLSDRSETTYSSNLSSGLGLRIIRYGKLGTAGCMMTDSMDKLVEMAIGSSGTGPNVNFSFTQPQDIKEIELIDPSLTELEYSEMANITANFKAEILNISPFAEVFGSLSVIERTFNLLNSEGFRGKYSKNFMEWNFHVFLPIRDGVCTLSSNGAIGTLDDLELWKLLESILLFAKNTHLVKPVLENSIPVILSPAVLHKLLQTFKAGAANPLSSTNPLRNMHKERMAPEQVTLSDLPRMLQGPASAPFDAEGVPTANRTLIDKGVFAGFLYDLTGAVFSGIEPTGNAGRNLDSQPQPVCTNLVMEPGMASFEEMVGDIPDGIILTDIPRNVRGNVLIGDFSFSTDTALCISGGEIVGCIENLLVKGNFYDIIANVFNVGADLFPVGTDLLPFISTGGIEFNIM